MPDSDWLEALLPLAYGIALAWLTAIVLLGAYRSARAERRGKSRPRTRDDGTHTLI